VTDPQHEEGQTLGPLWRQGLRAIIGPTASGKSELALRVAEQAGAEIVSLDSMLVYRGMDVGTAKPDAVMRGRVRHHMIDLVEPDVRYDVQRFLRDLGPVLAEIDARGARPLFVGGTAFYLKVLTHGLFQGPEVDLDLRADVERRVDELGPDAAHAWLERVDPLSAERLHANDRRRVVRALEVQEQTGRALSDWQREWRSPSGVPSAGAARRLVGVGHGVPDLDQRIHERTRRMLAGGWVEEALGIRARTGFGSTAIQALGYAQVLRLADGDLDEDACIDEIALRTRQFARKQRTWYRKFDEIAWLEGRVESDLERLTVEALHALDWER